MDKDSKPTYVSLTSGWHLTHNPEGGGLMLCINRGIACEGHTQILSSHTTNTPSLQTVQAIVDREGPALVRQIDAFVNFMDSLKDRYLKEHIGLLFAHYLVKSIADTAENREFYDTHDIRA
jgi:hypothetical protein